MKDPKRSTIKSIIRGLAKGLSKLDSGQVENFEKHLEMHFLQRRL